MSVHRLTEVTTHGVMYYKGWAFRFHLGGVLLAPHRMEVKQTMAELTLTPALTAMPMIAKTRTAVYLRLPRELQRPIEGGCSCEQCKVDPTLATWDTLVVPTTATPGYAFTHTVHMPNGSLAAFKAYVRKHEPASGETIELREWL